MNSCLQARPVPTVKLDTLQNAWATFNPQTTVPGGKAVTLGGDTLLDAATNVLAIYAQRVGLPEAAIRLTKEDDLATAAAGAGYALHAILNPYQWALKTRYIAETDALL